MTLPGATSGRVLLFTQAFTRLLGNPARRFIPTPVTMPLKRVGAVSAAGIVLLLVPLTRSYPSIADTLARFVVWCNLSFGVMMSLYHCLALCRASHRVTERELTRINRGIFYFLAPSPAFPVGFNLFLCSCLTFVHSVSDSLPHFTYVIKSLDVSSQTGGVGGSGLYSF